MQLERLQADFDSVLFDIDATGDSAALFANPSEVALHRLALYRGNIHAAWERALSSAYPVVQAIVGEEFFAALSRAYGVAHPSISGDLNRFGAHMAEFLRTFEHARALPYLADIATLEWQVHRAQYAADARALTRERMAAVSPDELLVSRFALHPACAWLESRFPVATLWLAHQFEPSAAMPKTLESAEWALVTRPAWQVEVCVSGAAEIAALAALHSGGDMDHAIGAALSVDRKFDFGKALVRWLDLGVLVDIR